LPNLGEYLLQTHYDQTLLEFLFSVLMIMTSEELSSVSFLPIIFLVLIWNVW
jgi:hypothetical protein